MAALKLAEETGTSVDAPVVETSTAVRSAGASPSLTLRTLLNHSAGLEKPRAAEIMFTRPRDRLGLVASGFAKHSSSAYSEFLTWHTLRIWIEDLSGLTLDGYVRHRILEPLGVEDIYFGMKADGTGDARARVGIHFEIFPEGIRPLWHELLWSRCDDPYLISVGGHGTMAAVGKIYEAVLDTLAGECSAALPSRPCLREAVRGGSSNFDRVLQRDVAFGLGFMTDLPAALGPEIGLRAFGHLGFLGNAFAFADPDHDLVCAILMNRFVFQRDGHTEEIRKEIIHCVYSDLARAA